jgi:cysteine desulfuration protein SufE
MTDPIPAPLRQIIDDFESSEGREKLELLLDYSARMPPIPENVGRDHDSMEQVHECMTPVFVTAVSDSSADRSMTFYFDIPPESPTVRGFAALLAEGLKGATPEQVLAVPADFYNSMGLEKVLTSQRMNGISAILAHMKRLALQEIHAGKA